MLCSTKTTLWHPDETALRPDAHVAFRGQFDLESATEIELNISGASWFVVWLDGEFLAEGPPRFPATHPEFQKLPVSLQAGPHTLAVHVHYLGVSMRVYPEIPPFLWCVVARENQAIAVIWKTKLLESFVATGRRISAQLGWVEWCDTRTLPLWQAPAFDDSDWLAPQIVWRANWGRCKRRNCAKCAKFRTN